MVSGGAMGRETRTFEAAIDEFGDLCRRTRRARVSVLQMLLPPELAQDASMMQ